MAIIRYDEETHEVSENVGALFNALKTKLIDSEKKQKEIEAQVKISFLKDKALTLGAKEDDLKDKTLDYIEGFIAGVGERKIDIPQFSQTSYDDLVIELGA